MSRKSLILALVLLALAALPAFAGCPGPVNNAPVFPSPGGNVFGATSPQWQAYFAAKVDSTSGTLCGPTIQNLPPPVNPGDAASKGYVDSATVNPNTPHTPVVVATATVLPNSPVYVNGSGPPFGSTLTSSTNTALVIDGVTVSTLGTRVLVNKQSTAAQNGIYVLSAVGISGTAPWALTRATDFDNPIPGNLATGSVVLVLSSGGGVTQKGTTWQMATPPTIVVGTTPINWVQISEAGQYSADETSLHLTGNVFSVKSGGTFPTGLTIPGYLASANNLSDVASVSSALTNLGLGTSATPTFANVTLSALAGSGTRCMQASSAGVPGTTSGPCAVGTGNVSAGGTLTANQLIVGSGGTAIVPLGAAGTLTTVLHGNPSGMPSFGSVNLATDVSGLLPFSSLTSLPSTLAGHGITSPLPVAQGGTNATTAVAALTSLGAAPSNSPTFTGSITATGLSSGMVISGGFLGLNSSNQFVLATPPGGGNVSTSGSITNGTLAIWATGTTIAGTQAFGQTGNSTVIETDSSGNMKAPVNTTTGTFSGQITSTVSTGTAPFVVASTTNIPNLNASSLGGATFASPGAIGGTTPGSGVFTSAWVNKANWAATPNCSGCTNTSTVIGGVLGSSGTPDTSASPALIAQKFVSASTPTGLTNPAFYAASTKFASTNGVSQRAIYAEANDPVGWTSGAVSYSEAIRATTNCTSAAVTCLGYGGVFTVYEHVGASSGFLVGVESEVDPTSYGGSGTFNPNHFAAPFVATSGLTLGSSSTNVDTGFLINPHIATNAQFLRGYYCPTGGGGVGDASSPVRPSGGACFSNDAPIDYSLDSHLAGVGKGHIWLPNSTYLLGSDTGGSPRRMAVVDGSNNLLLGFDSAFSSIVLGNSLPTIVSGSLSVTGSITANGLSSGTVVSGGWIGLNSSNQFVLATPSGAGNVSGPGSSVTNDIVVWANTSGTLLKDSNLVNPFTTQGALTGTQTADAAIMTAATQSGTTANQIYQWSICQNSSCGGSPIFTVDALRGVGVAPNSSTGLVNGVSGYVLNNNTNTSPLGQSVGVGAYAVANANNSNTWGMDSIVADQEFLTTGTGSNRGLFNEWDFNISNSTTHGTGLSVGGTWLVQPAGVNGVAVNTPWGSSRSGPSTPFAKWGNGLLLQNGCCTYGMDVGTSTYTPTASDLGLPNAFAFRDSTATQQLLTLTASPATGGTFNLGGSFGWGISSLNGSSNPNGLALGVYNVATPSPFNLATPNQPSQYVLMNYTNAAGTQENYNLRANPSGIMEFTSTEGSSVAKYNLAGAVTSGPDTATGALTGTQTADAAIMTGLTHSGLSANTLYQEIICPSSCPSNFTVGAVRGVLDVTNNSTNVMNAVEGWVVNNNSASGSIGLAVGAASIAYGVANVNNSKTWGFNSLLIDNPFVTLSSATNRQLYNEFDFNITSSSTTGIGLSLGPGTWLAQPASMTGLFVNTPWGSSLSGPSSPFAKWSEGVFTFHGCCMTAMQVGTQTYNTVNNDASQVIDFNYRGSSGDLRALSISALNDSLVVGGLNGWGVYVNDGGTNASAYQTGKTTAGSTPNTSSHYFLWNFNDSSGVTQNYAAQVNTSGILSFTISSGTGQYLFNGSVTAAGNLAATLASSTSALAYTCYNSITGFFTYDSSGTCLVSSLRFKHDVHPVENAISRVMDLAPIDFVYNDQSNLPGRHVGISAESVAAAVPELAAYDADGRPEKVKYIELIGLLTAAVQEQQREIQSLKEQVAGRR